MCDMAADYLDNKAQKSVAAQQQALYNRSVGAMREGFDARGKMIDESTGRTNGLLDGEFSQTRGLQDQTFDYMLDQNRQGFDEQSTIASRNFDTQMSELDGLMTTTRAVRLEQQATVEAERSRQRGFQGEADALGAALPGNIGFDAQQVARAGAETARRGFARANISAPTVDAPSGGQIGDLFARRAAEGVAAGQAQTDAASRVSAYGDAASTADRRLGAFGDAVRQITANASLSRAPLQAELRPGDIRQENAQKSADWTIDLADRQAEQESGIKSGYRSGLTGAETDYAGNMGSVLSDFFGGSLDSEQRRLAGVTDASAKLEQARVNANNYKAQGTRGYSPLGQMIRTANKAAAQAMAGGG